ncbi:MAG: toxin-antitoxin system HicB family antitoxin [Planctomycetes bacterium]|nr:toxin-antitoxin system HicB family antitoxin [Planctomycetota bacterium]
MPHYSIKVSWSEQDSMFVAVCPALGNISALGDSAREAVAEMEQAIELALETYAAEGWPTPEPDALEEHSGQFRLRLPRSMHGWLAHEAERQGVSLNTLATTLLAHAMGTAEARMTFTREIETTLNSMRAMMVSAMRTAMFETADSSTSRGGEVQPAEYIYQGSPSRTFSLVKKAG